jgi:hypothetical protein
VQILTIRLDFAGCVRKSIHVIRILPHFGLDLLVIIIYTFMRALIAG